MDFNLNDLNYHHSRQAFLIIFNGLREMTYFFNFDIMFDTDSSLLYSELMRIRVA